MNYPHFKARLAVCGIFVPEDLKPDSGIITRAVKKAKRIFTDPTMQADVAASDVINFIKPMLKRTGTWLKG
jgi:hypothetical protein